MTSVSPAHSALLSRDLSSRVLVGTSAIAVTLATTTLVHVLTGHRLTASITAVVVAVAAALHIGWRKRWIPQDRGGVTLFVMWLTVHVANLLCTVEVDPALADTWLSITLLAYATLQVDRKWLAAGVTLGGLTWAAFHLGVHHNPYGLVSVAGTIGVTGMVFLIQRRFLSAVADLRARDQVRERALRDALDNARRELQERQRLEAERDAIRERFVAAQRMEAMGTLAGSVAHELNNVLAGVLGIAELVAADVDTHRDDLHAIVAACKRGGALTSSLLRFARRQPVEDTGPVDVIGLLGEVEPILRRGCPADTTLEVMRPEAALDVLASRADLGQAITNLCLNAFDATPRGKVIVRVESRDVDDDHAAGMQVPPGRYVAIEVADTGAGMPPDVAARACEPFFTTKPPGQGTGLGLAQVHGTFRAARGALVVHSTPGLGTTITGYLPEVRSPWCDDDAPAPAQAPDIDADGLPTPRVLVVDDEALIRAVYVRVLTRAGMDVVAAASGEEALSIIEAHDAQFDATLLDVRMPGIDGFEVLRRVRGRGAPLPIVLASGHVTDDLAEDARQWGATLVLRKPVAPDDLVRAMRRAVATHPPAPRAGVGHAS